MYRRALKIMNGMKYFLSGVCLLVIVIVSGCVVVSDGHALVVVEEIEIGCAPPSPPAAVIVTRPPRPSRFHIWIEGHHVVQAGEWV